LKPKKIAWVADFVVKTYKAGGAQYTNEMVINAGRDKGYNIDIITKDDTPGYDYDLYILNNIRYINIDFLNEIIYKKNYIRWEHDYWVCGAYKHDKKFTGILENSLLNLFMSKRHIAECEKDIDFKIPNKNYVVSPIDTDLFFIDKKIKKDKNLVVWTGHDKPDNKGFETVMQYAKASPKLKFKMFGIFKEEHDLPDNVEIIGEVDQPIFARSLQKAQYLMAVPNWIEPSGRSVLEGLLCGCDLIVNDNIGVLSEKIDFNDYKKIVELAHSEDRFWNMVEKISE